MGSAYLFEKALLLHAGRNEKYSLGQGNYEISDKNVKRWCWLCKFYYLSLKARGDKVKETSFFPNFPSGFYSFFSSEPPPATLCRGAGPQLFNTLQRPRSGLSAHPDGRAHERDTTPHHPLPNLSTTPPPLRLQGRCCCCCCCWITSLRGQRVEQEKKRKKKSPCRRG